MKEKIYINGRFLTQKTTGAQRFAQEIAKNIIRNYDNFIVVCPENIINHKLAKELNAQILKGFSGQLWEQITLRNYLKSKGSPILINLSFTAPFFYKRNIIIILDLIYRFKHWVSKPFHYYYSFLIPKLASRAIHIFTISEFSKKDIIKYLKIDKKKVDVIYCGTSDSFKKVYEKNNYGKYVLGVSTINKRKNFDGLIHGFLKSQLIDCKLLLVGSEDKKIYSNVEFTKYSNLKNIIFTGYVSEEELVNLYSNAQIFVYPSLYEGFGLPPLEAMACGCPTAVSNVTSLPEVCGDASLYFNPNDYDSIKDAISKIYNDERIKNDLINKGYKRVNHFDWEASSKKLVEKIKKLQV